jgi:cephalosporin hydroxylase
LTLETFSGHKASQNEWELTQFLDLLRERKVRKYLEIGARDGDTLHAVGRVLAPGASLIAVDLPGALWGYAASIQNLRRASLDLRNMGHKVHMVLGSSLASEVIYQVKKHGPYDAILIDGDHTYGGVSADWAIYGGMAPIVALHDIAGYGVTQRTTRHEVEVPKFWAEVKVGREVLEFIAPESLMGIGVIITRSTHV